MVSMIRNLALRSGLGFVLAILALLFMAGGVWALITGTAASTANTVSAVGADIQVRDEDEVYASSVSSSLSAQFRANTEEVLAGFIDVRNNGVEPFANGYVLTNEANPAPSEPEDVALNNALLVVIEAALIELDPLVPPCAPASGGGLQTVVQAETAWATLDTGTIAAINLPGAEQRLCFYLKLVGVDNSVSGGEVMYDLTFTAS